MADTKMGRDLRGFFLPAVCARLVNTRLSNMGFNDKLQAGFRTREFDEF